MKRAILIFICLCFSIILNAQVKLEMKWANKAPVIDGYIDEIEENWGSFKPIEVRNQASTTTGMTGQFNIVGGSGGFFYIAIVVQDATPNNDSNSIPNSDERDCSEIFFSMDTVTKTDGAYTVGCWHIRTQREGEILCDGNSGANTWSISTLTSDPNFKVASETSKTEYVQEMILPFQALIAGLDDPWIKYIRFDICINDNTTGATGGQTEQRYWYGHNGLGDDHGSDNTRSLGIVKLPIDWGSNPLIKDEKFRIFPNPATDGFSISGLEDKATICVTDLNGRLLLTKHISGNETIPVHSFSPGLYFVKVITNAGTIKKKLVKH